MPSWSALVLSAAWLGGAASLALLAKPSSLSTRAAFASWCCVVCGAAELDAAVLLLLVTTSHSDDAGTIRALALLLLGLRVVVASVLAVYCAQLARRSLRQAAGPSPGGLRSWLMLLVLLPLNLELLQLLPWPVVKHDGLPTAAVLASCTAASLAHGLGTVMLQLWFACVVLPSGELADSVLTEGGALPLGLLLSLGALCWLGARRVRMLLRDPALAVDDGADAGRLCVLALPTAAGVLDQRRSGGHDDGASDADDDDDGGAISCTNVCLDVACRCAAQSEASCASALELDSPPADGGALRAVDVARGGEASGGEGGDVQSLALSRQRQLAARARVEARQRLQALVAYPATPPPLKQRSSGSSLSGGEPSDSGGYNSSGSDFLGSVLSADAAGLPAAHCRDHALSRVSDDVSEEGLGSAATPLDIAAAADSGTTVADTVKQQVQSRVKRASESNSHRRAIEAGTAATTAAAAAAAAATAGALREAAETSSDAGAPADAASAEAVRAARRATSMSTASVMAAVGLGGEAGAAIAGPLPEVVASRIARAREAKAASAEADSGTSSASGGGGSCGGPPRSPGIGRPAAPRPAPGSPSKDIQARVATHMARVRASTHDQQVADSAAETGTHTANEVGTEAEDGNVNDEGSGETLERTPDV